MTKEFDARNAKKSRAVCEAMAERGDTVYEPNGQSGIVTAVHPSTRCVDLRQDGCDSYAMDTKRLTHTRPDSWERLEEDAADLDDMPCDFNAKDLVRRAKALAGVEVGR